MKKINKKVVFLMMSGGVDSSVAGLLLKKKGYEVVGIFMKNIPDEVLKNLPTFYCTYQKDIKDAKLTASVLKIPFYAIDFSKEYKRKVFDYMIKEYKNGLTPNPDVVCNKEIKFGIFKKWAFKNGADFVASGHYARIVKENREFFLYAGVDKTKDQSYFLWQIKKEDLNKIIFPIGELKKTEVRKIARENRLPVSDKKDSQGLCFIGKFKFKEFLKQFIPEKTGIIVDSSNNIIGKHKGAWYFTIGQRHGLNIKNGKGPYYVIGKDIKKNIIIIENRKKIADFYKKELIAINLNWIVKKLNFPLTAFSRIRYQQPLQKCKILKFDYNKIKVEFEKPQFAIAPGQSIVFYDNKGKVLGGGVISENSYKIQDKIMILNSKNIFSKLC